MNAAAVIEQATAATVQDLGRHGYAHLGISHNGASDQHSARLANALVGNAPDAPVLEVTGSSLSLRTERPLLLAVTGAAGELLLDGVAAPALDPIAVDAGTKVTIPPPQVGQRSYLAINGKIAAPCLLGSVAPEPLLGFVGRLSAGDTLQVATRFRSLAGGRFPAPLIRLGAQSPTLTSRGVLDVTPGPELDQFPSTLFDEPFVVAPQSDYIGLRLEGPVPPRSVSDEILSRGVPSGAIEVTPDGLIVLLRGHYVTAGYPLPAVATTVAVDRLAQARPGAELRFRLVTTATARAAARRRGAELIAVARRLDTVLRSLGQGDLVDPRHPSRC